MSIAIGRYSEIHLNRSKGLGIKGFRPDVTGVTKNGLRVVEVVSSSQTYASQVSKVGRMMEQYSHISYGLTLDVLRFITNGLFSKDFFKIVNLKLSTEKQCYLNYNI